MITFDWTFLDSIAQRASGSIDFKLDEIDFYYDGPRIVTGSLQETDETGDVSAHFCVAFEIDKTPECHLGRWIAALTTKNALHTIDMQTIFRTEDAWVLDMNLNEGDWVTSLGPMLRAWKIDGRELSEDYLPGKVVMTGAWVGCYEEMLAHKAHMESQR